jgi:hypothetical protein
MKANTNQENINTGDDGPKFKPVKVGFDLDGVLFFNPLRIVRRPLEIFKTVVLQDHKKDFYIPKSWLMRQIWRLVHMSSLRPAKGWKAIQTLRERGLIAPYLITARFSCLQQDFETFVACINNSHDEQPHLFKERMVKDLGIQIFVEDNWSIVKHLSQNTDAKALWITNLMDLDIEYPQKYLDLQSAIDEVEKIVKNQIIR